MELTVAELRLVLAALKIVESLPLGFPQNKGNAQSAARKIKAELRRWKRIKAFDYPAI